MLFRKAIESMPVVADAKRGDFSMRELSDTESLPESAKPIVITTLPEGWYPGSGK